MRLRYKIIDRTHGEPCHKLILPRGSRIVDVVWTGTKLKVYYESTDSLRDQIRRFWLIEPEYTDLPVGRYVGLLHADNLTSEYHVYTEY